MSNWLLFKCYDILMLRWLKYKNSVFPNFNFEHNCVFVCLCSKMHSNINIFPNVINIFIILNLNGHLDFHDCLIITTL